MDETKNDPTPIGNVEIDASIIFTNPENNENGKYIYDKWYDLTLNGRRAGMIYLEMTFYPTAPVLPPKILLITLKKWWLLMNKINMIPFRQWDKV